MVRADVRIEHEETQNLGFRASPRCRWTGLTAAGYSRMVAVL